MCISGLLEQVHNAKEKEIVLKKEVMAQLQFNENLK